MILSEISIKRPVLATVMSLVIVLMGFLSYSRMAVREYPNIDPPIVSVRTVYKGATAQVIESAVTQPLEDSLSGIEGIKTIKSNSREEVSQITITFLTEPRSGRGRGRRARPCCAHPQAAARRPSMNRSYPRSKRMHRRSSGSRSPAIANRRWRSPISPTAISPTRSRRCPGVSSVIIGGERKYAMRIWLDRERLAAQGLTVQDVENALHQPERRIPGRAHREHAARIHRAAAHRPAVAG